MHVGIWFGGKNRRAYDARAVAQRQEDAMRRSERALEPRLNFLGHFLQLRAPHWIEHERAGNDFAQFRFVVAGGGADLVVFRECVFELRKLSQIPGKPNPVAQLHRGAW